MAQPDIIRGTYFVLAMGDGGSPTENFTALCGIKTRSFTQQANTSDNFIRDCADPEDVPIRRLIVTGKQWSLSGDGDLNRSQIDTINSAFGITKNYRFYWTEPTDDEVFAGYYEGPAILTNVQIGGNDDTYATLSVQLESDGEWIFHATAGS